MQISMTFAPFSTCCRATLPASSYLPSLISRANFGDPATFVRSPIIMYTPGCCVNGCDPESLSGFTRCVSAAPAASTAFVFSALTPPPQLAQTLAAPHAPAPSQSPLYAREYSHSIRPQY